MNILLVNPPIRLRDKPRHIPHGLAIIANIIRKHFKCTIKLIDWNAHRYSEDKFFYIIKDIPCDLAMIGGLIPTYKYLIKISDIIKENHPKCKIIAGGSAAMSVPDTLLTNSSVDIVCTGEGEITVVKLIEAFQQEKKPDLYKINNIAFKEMDGSIVINEKEALIADLDTESTLPAYDLLPMDIYLSNTVVGLGRDIDFITGRGCPFNCSFCYQPWGRKSRKHSPEFVKNAIEYLIKDYNIDFVSFQDDLFIADKNWFLKFCELRNKHFSKIYWSCTGRVNICDEKIISTARKSGCTLISYGFESGSPKMLKSMKKMASLGQMEKVIHLNRKYGFPIPVSFILGMPGEDKESCNETIAFCKKNNLTLDSLMFATPYPGTELFDFAVQTGRIKMDEIHNFIMKLRDARDFIINLTDTFSNEELQQKYQEMISIAKESYKPLSLQEKKKRIKSLYGHLSEKFFNMPPEDIEHQAKHGAIGMF